MASRTCALQAMPSWFETVSNSVSASAIASSFLSRSIRRSGSAAYPRPKFARVISERKQIAPTPLPVPLGCAALNLKAGTV